MSECDAHGNRGGIVCLQDLYEYAGQEATRAARALGANQHPVLKEGTGKVLPLVKVATPRQ